ncbi:hypothetical protein MUK42_34073 [Musa troglodytarum]|uniref:Uncharacterized protein n=1 Tax=Musa troglodytarum TaxID=320322 RepID=A0A9E7EEE7_9LILI|nr:hypothetical protein MUK42_34073 [Musa troglodytarum]
MWLRLSFSRSFSRRFALWFFRRQRRCNWAKGFAPLFKAGELGFRIYAYIVPFFLFYVAKVL